MFWTSDTPGTGISIHALREEGDRTFLRGWQTARISIHALREEGDLLSVSSRTAAQ